MPIVTALRAKRRGWLAVELDRASWRDLPVEVVARAGLFVELELDRAHLRTIARELRRSRALAVAGGVLRRRDASVRGLDAELERAGVAPVDRRETVETLSRAGLVDDERYAFGRAEALSERGRGDAAIRFELEAHSVSPELVERALEALEPEALRARRLVEKRGASASTARLLARRGFAEDTIEAALDRSFAAEP